MPDLFFILAFRFKVRLPGMVGCFSAGQPNLAAVAYTKEAVLRRGSGQNFGKSRIDISGNSHQLVVMPTATSKRARATGGISIVQHYDIAADAKNRISLRGATAKYFHVQALSNGSYVLQPRVLVSPDAIPARTLKMLANSVARLKKGEASAPVDLSRFVEG